jgi:hypothetical protein
VRVNRPDTLLTELREIRRRLRLLEAARMAPPAGATPASAPSPPVPLLPARPADWPATTSTEWERLAVTRAVPAGAALTIQIDADPGTTGAVRIVLDDTPLAEEIPAAPGAGTHTVPLPDTAAETEVAVEGRLRAGPGALRLTAVLHRAGR